jgi:hypothetical protein
VFDRGTWWDPDGFLIGLHTLLDTVRLPYFMSILHRRVPLGSPVLDMGCGGGQLKRRSIGYGEAGRRIELSIGRSKALSYLGYATLANR